MAMVVMTTMIGGDCGDIDDLTVMIVMMIVMVFMAMFRMAMLMMMMEFIVILILAMMKYSRWFQSVLTITSFNFLLLVITEREAIEQFMLYFIMKIWFIIT